MNASQSGNSMPRIIGGLVILVVAGTILYYIYDYWYNIGGLQQKSVIIANPIKSTNTSSTSTFTVYPDSGNSINLRDYIYTGGELSTSFWIYVTGMTDYTKKKHIISLEAGTTEPTLIVALGAKENKLYVRVRDGGMPQNTTFSKSTFMTTDTLTSNTVDGKTVTETPYCSVNNFESGRWVNVIVVLNNNICDVYVDGKLSRSCKLKGQWQVEPGTGATPPALVFKILDRGYDGTDTGTNFLGSFSNFVYYNYALSPDHVYRIYMAGPSGASVNFFEGLKRFFGVSTTTSPVIA